MQTLLLRTPQISKKRGLDMAAKKAMKKPKSNDPKLRFTVNHALTTIYVTLLFTLFPLFLSNYYYAVRRDKFALFAVLTCIAGVAVGAVALATFINRNNEYNKKLNTYHDPFKLSITDIGIFAFAAVSVISTLASDSISHSFTGLTYYQTYNQSGQLVTKNYGGRNMGLFMILMLVVCYLIISRFFFNRKFVFYAIFAGMTIVIMLAILNYHSVDPLGIFEKHAGDNTVQQNFTSTIGNKNYLSALVCVSLMFSVGMAMATKDMIMRIVAFVSTGIQFMGLLVATSDGGFLGFFAAMAVLLVIACRNHKKLMWYFLALAVMMLSAKILTVFENKSKGYSSFSSFFIESELSVAILLVSLGVFTALYLLDRRNENFTLPSYLIYIVLGIIGVAVAVIVALFINYSVIDTTTVLEKDSFLRFFRYNDYWGTHRGFFWNRTFKIYGEMNLFEQLFGAGPETYYFKFEPMFGELLEFTNNKEGSVNAAHNVYLNYLITHGIVGLAAYLTFVGAAIVSCFKRAKDNPLALACLGVIVAYATQDIVNIANPVNTAWLFAFIGLSEAALLRANSTQQLTEYNF